MCRATGKGRTIWINILCAFAAVGMLNCGGGGGSDRSGGVPNPTSTPSPPPGNSRPTVLVKPETETVSPGALIERKIEVRDMGESYYTAFDVDYDPQVLEYISATEGNFLSQNGAHATTFQVALVDGTEGHLKLGVTRLAQSSGVVGDGTLATLTFKAIGTGSTTIAFKDPKGFRTLQDQGVRVDAWETATVNVQ